MAEPVVRPESVRKRNGSFSDEALFLTDAPVPGLLKPPKTAPNEYWSHSVTNWNTLDALRTAWTDLAASAAEPNAFYEPWMLLPALRSFARRGRVEVVVVFQGDVLCGLFPMEYRFGRAELWRHPYCYLSAPLLRRGSERAAIRCWLDAVRKRASVVRIQEVPGDGSLRLNLVDELHERSWPAIVSQAY